MKFNDFEGMKSLCAISVWLHIDTNIVQQEKTKIKEIKGITGQSPAGGYEDD